MIKNLNSVTTKIRKAEDMGKQALKTVAVELYNAKLLIDSGVNTLVNDDTVEEFKNITEYGKNVFGYSPANTSKLTAVSERFLLTDSEMFKDYSISQLVEMLPIPSDTLDNLLINGIITSNSTCVEIRKIASGLLTDKSDNTDNTDNAGNTDNADNTDNVDNADDTDNADNTDNTDIKCDILSNIDILIELLKEEESAGIDLLMTVKKAIIKL